MDFLWLTDGSSLEYFQPNVDSLWLTDGSSVEYLDLCAREFHEKRNTTLIYALDLRIAPLRYSYLKDIPTKREQFQRESCENESFFPNSKLIEIFMRGTLLQLALDAVSFSFFNDFSDIALQRLITKWEVKAARRFLKYVKAYCHYVEKSLFHAIFFPNDVIPTFEKPPILYDMQRSLAFTRSVTEKAARNIMKILFKNQCPDSSLVAEFFHTMCIRGSPKLHTLFIHEAELLEYILKHLTSEKYDITHIFDILIRKCSHEIRSNPKHLLVLLKYGLKYIFKHYYAFIDFIRLYPSKNGEIYWGIQNMFERGRTDVKPREAAITEVLVYFKHCSFPHFAVYMECVRYIWRSIPDAFISYEEMKGLLIRNANATYPEALCENLQKCEFDSFDMILQPRSLLHYSRCVLRHTLMCNSQLIDGISFLGLPKRLQAYLKLEY